MYRFVWNRVKSDANYRDRGFDFDFASLIFEGFFIAVEDRRRDCGETRFVAIGMADGIHLTVVFMDRPTVGGDIVRRIISAGGRPDLTISGSPPMPR